MPQEHQQHLELAANYPKINVAYTQIATIATDEHHTLQEFRGSVGAQWPFPSDPTGSCRRTDIAGYTDPDNNPMIPYTFVLKPGLVIHSIYNGYWFWGRPSFYDLWRDLRAATAEVRPDWDLATPGLREAWQAGDLSEFPRMGPAGEYVRAARAVVRNSGTQAGGPSGLASVLNLSRLTSRSMWLVATTWAAGGTSDLTGFQPAKPIAMHWNGTAWSLAALSDLGNGGLTSVTASSPSSVWAAGLVGGTMSVVHWNGTSWAPESTPVGSDGQPNMTGISAVPGSATEVWAVGTTLPSGDGYHAFAIHHP